MARPNIDLFAERNPPCLLRLLCGRWGGIISLFLVSAALNAQTCSRQTRFTPFGMVVMFRNGTMLKIADYTMANVPGTSRPSFTPNRFADQDAIAVMYTRAMNLPGTTTPWGYSLVREEWNCSGWNPPILFSLDSTTASQGNAAILHVSFTNAIVLAAGLQFTLNYDPLAINSIAASPGQSAANAFKNVTCADSNPRGSFACVIAGSNLNNMADGIVANISVTTYAPGVNNQLPTTVTFSGISGQEIGVNLLATIPIQAQVSPTSTGVISPPAANLLDTTEPTNQIMQLAASCDGTNGPACDAAFSTICSQPIPPNCIVGCPPDVGFVLCNPPVIQDGNGIWRNAAPAF